MSYLVTGATGNIGREVVRSLAEAGEPVRALVRSDGAVLPDGVTPVVGDLNRPETFRDALPGVRGLFLLPGYQNMAGTLAAARDAGVTRVTLLSGGSAGNTEDPDNAVTRYMAASEAAVRESGLSWTFLRPSAFMSNALEWVEQLRTGDVVRAAFADVRMASTDPADIGAVAARTLVSAGHEGEILTLSGPEALLPADRVRILGEVLGRELRFEGLSNEEAHAQMIAAMPAEYVAAFFSFYVDGTLDESVLRPTVREVLGREPRTFRQWAEAHADAFR